MEHFLDGKAVLITGGTGSFGRAFAKRLLSTTKASRVIIFSRDEWKQWQMQQDPQFSHPAIRYFLGDVRDHERLLLALQDVQVVVHAAALKQVPAAEYNPSEFVKTNVLGASNITSAAIERGVERVIALSSDKAVNPINLYGATKLCADKLVIAANAYVGKRGNPRFSVVRYGNVLGSRGSLLPLWQSLVEKNEPTLPVTDLAMTRFGISLDQAVDFVLMAIAEQQGGEIFVPKCPSFKIADLAKALYPQKELSVIGIRPGEKIHEVLVAKDDACNTYEYQTHYRIVPPFVFLRTPKLDSSLQEGRKVAEDFSLDSCMNPWFISSPEKIREVVSAALC
jgi:UDP-N-acetylglucosamine 4,6-dehydratase